MAKTYYYHNPLVKTDAFPQLITQLMEPISIAINAIDMMCWVAGAAFIVGAFLRYLQHQYNPSQSPLSQAFFLSAVGIALFLLPLIGQYALPHA